MTMIDRIWWCNGSGMPLLLSPEYLWRSDLEGQERPGVALVYRIGHCCIRGFAEKGRDCHIRLSVYLVLLWLWLRAACTVQSALKGQLVPSQPQQLVVRWWCNVDDFPYQFRTDPERI